MNTLVLKVNPQEPDLSVLATAANVIRRGGLVAFPTETVYGLGANALDPVAVRSIFAAKGRPLDNPVIVHVSHHDQVRGLVSQVTPVSQILMERFWPGPLTLVLPRSEAVPPEVCAGLDTVALRMPAHKVALKLIELAGVPIAAPSANASGRPSPTRASHVLEDLDGKVDVILDAGPTGVGVESTVVDARGTPVVVLRPGGVTLEQLKQALGSDKVILHRAALDETALGSGPPPSPGMKYRHYAPKAKLIVVAGLPDRLAAVVLELAHKFSREGKSVAILASEETAHQYRSEYRVLVAGSRRQLDVVAANLFAKLRECDRMGVDVVIAEGYPEEGVGLAVMNRLLRAAGGQVIRV
ncbi:MAG: L-threonylcarbamoyladenylate synthase [Bacillota bacterium]